MNKKKLLEQIRKFEAEGRANEAIKLLIEVGAWQAAATMLIQNKRFDEARELLSLEATVTEALEHDSDDFMDAVTTPDMSLDDLLDAPTIPGSMVEQLLDVDAFLKVDSINPLATKQFRSFDGSFEDQVVVDVEVLAPESSLIEESAFQFTHPTITTPPPQISESSVRLSQIALLEEDVSYSADLDGYFYPFTQGALIAERYQILEHLGEGGAAKVFRAFDTELHEDVALKVFEPGISEKSLTRMKRELKICRKLSHPNVLKIFDLGSYDNHHYLIMELLSGQDLEVYLRTQGVSIGLGLNFMIQACQGLQATHQLGVIHRDLKPSNLFITEEKQLKIMDFGIAHHNDGAKLTKTGTVIGTAAYISPERISDEVEISEATDLYSLGVVAFEIFTGQLPFGHADFLAVMMQHLVAEVPSPRSLNPEIPAELEQVIFQLLSKEPEARQQTCEELLEQLHQIQSNRY